MVREIILVSPLRRAIVDVYETLEFYIRRVIRRVLKLWDHMAAGPSGGHVECEKRTRRWATEHEEALCPAL